MISIRFSPQQMLSDLEGLTQEAADLQRSMERGRCCGGYFKKDISMLRVSLQDKSLLIDAVRAQHPLQKNLSALSAAVEKAKRAVEAAQTALDRQAAQWDRFKFWKWNVFSAKPGLTLDQKALIERFIGSDKPDWELNQKIAQDVAVVKELVQKNAPLRKKGDRECSLLVALASVYQPLEAIHFELKQKHKELSFFWEGAKRMEEKLGILHLLLRTKQWTSEDGFYFLYRCLTEDSLVFLDHLFKKKMLQNLLPLPPEKQMDLWLAVSSDKGAGFLKKIGCDPNVRCKGRTPLIELAARGYSYPLSAAKLAGTLLRAGADPEAIDPSGHKAWDLAQDPYLEVVLNM